MIIYLIIMLALVLACIPSMCFLAVFIVGWNTPDVANLEGIKESGLWILKRRVLGWSFVAILTVAILFSMTVIGDFLKAKEAKVQYQPVQEQLYRRAS